MERISSKFQLKPSRRKQTNERKEEASEGREWRKQLLFFTSKKNKMREGLTHLIAERQKKKKNPNQKGRKSRKTLASLQHHNWPPKHRDKQPRSKTWVCKAQGEMTGHSSCDFFDTKKAEITRMIIRNSLHSKRMYWKPLKGKRQLTFGNSNLVAWV
jgi:hypothetical protein